MVITAFEFHQLLHCGLPSPPGHLPVADRQIGAGDLKIDGGLLLRLVPGMQEAKRRGPIMGAQALLFSRDAVVDVVPTAATAAVQSKPLFI
jgi:hypothetical protein